MKICNRFWAFLILTWVYFNPTVGQNRTNYTFSLQNGIDFQLSDSSICLGDTVQLTILGSICNARINPQNQIQWLDSTHAILIPSISTGYTIQGLSNCTVLDSGFFTINVLSLPQIHVSAGTVPCNGGVATVTVTANGGIGPYQGTGIYSAPAGLHVYSITDNAGCMAKDSLNITEPSPLNENINAGTINCYGDSGMITVSASGGTPPYQGTGIFYRLAGQQTFLVKDSNGCISSLGITLSQPPQLLMQLQVTPIHCFGDSATVLVQAFGGTPQYTGTGTFHPSPGTYYYHVTDLQGCTAVDSATIPAVPPVYVAVTADTNIICSGDSVQICASTGFTTYRWNIPGDTNICIKAKAAGNYYVFATDSNNCTYQSNHLNIQTLQPLPISINVKGDTIKVLTGNGYTWFLNDSLLQNETGNTLIATEDGIYKVRVVDNNGCYTWSNPINITAVEDITADNSNLIKIYPNPIVGSNCSLVVNEEWTNANVSIINERGQTIYYAQLVSGNSTIPFSYPAGVYFVKVSRGTAVVYKQIIKR